MCSGKIFPSFSASGLIRLRGNLQLHSTRSSRRATAASVTQLLLLQHVCTLGPLGQRRRTHDVRCLIIN
jgi:hypothetical protein